jgi:signal transduction histidine kinase
MSPASIRSRLSLAQRLSLLTGAVVALCLALALTATYEVLTRSAVTEMQDRLVGGTRQLASSAAISIRQTRARYASIAADSAVRRALVDTIRPRGRTQTSVTDAMVERAQRVLAGLANPTDSGLRIELWTARNRRVISTRPGAPPTPLFAPIDSPSLAARRILQDALAAAGTSDSLQFSRMYVSRGHVFFWLVQPIAGERGLLGYLAHERRIALNSQADTNLRALTGPGISTYYANDNGSVWTTVGGQPVAAHWHAAGATSGRAVDPSGEQVLIARAPIVGTPLEIVIESQLSVVRDVPALRELSVLALLLLIGAMGAALLIGKRVTGPIVAAANAAEAIARGQYDVRVPDEGDAEISRLAASFNHMAKEVAAAEETRREIAHMGRVAAVAELAASISHELRQPLTAIRASAESGLLLLERSESNPAEEEEGLRCIIDDCERAADVIDHMRFLLRKDESVATIVDLNLICREVVHLLRQDAALRRIALESWPRPGALLVVGDPVQLQQVILNLALNALDAASSSAGLRKVTVQTSATDSMAEVAVRDHGPGIAPEVGQRLFEPFFTTKTQGLGMGLAIVRSIVERHEGHVSAANAPDGGAVFRVTLPLAGSSSRVLRTAGSLGSGAAFMTTMN